jgi:hypothetical protein
MQHSSADVTRMRRLMPAAAAGKNRDLSACIVGRQASPNHNVLVFQERLAWSQVYQTFEHFAYDSAGIVDELLHFWPRAAHRWRAQ